MLNKSGFMRKMPNNSFAQKDMFARYKMSVVEVPTTKIKVYGAIAR